MLIFPAIDILGGKCVRLTQGDFARRTTYADDPFSVARNFEAHGARMLHIVDLDGAKSGQTTQRDLILGLARRSSIPIQVGGGIRTFADASAYLEQGVFRIVMGTEALGNKDLLRDVIKKFGSHRIVAALEIKNGLLATHGWTQESSISIENAFENLWSAGIETVLATDISSDGTMKNDGFTWVRTLLRSGLNIIASGGISSLTDLQTLQRLGCSAAVVGKALYERNLDLPSALRALTPPSTLAKRVIPCLDVREGKVVKGVRFREMQNVGDPVELAKRYMDEGADELVFLDISASTEDRGPLLDMIRQVAKEISIPFTVGGGVSTVSDIEALLQAGADKVSVNTAAVERPALIAEAAEQCGKQCIVVAIDARKTLPSPPHFVRGRHPESSSGQALPLNPPVSPPPLKKEEGKDIQYEVMTHSGTRATRKDALAWAQETQRLGAGEILLTSVDRDGTKAGFDTRLLNLVSLAVSIPVIASGGAGTLDHLAQAFTHGHADAVLLAGLLHRGETSIPVIKHFLSECSIPIRL